MELYIQTCVHNCYLTSSSSIGERKEIIRASKYGYQHSTERYSLQRRGKRKKKHRYIQLFIYISSDSLTNLKCEKMIRSHFPSCQKADGKPIVTCERHFSTEKRQKKRRTKANMALSLIGTENLKRPNNKILTCLFAEWLSSKWKKYMWKKRGVKTF